MQPLSTISLKQLNSFGCEETASFFVEVTSKETLIEALNWAKTHKQPYFILGGGSNILLTKKVEGLVIKIAIKGIQKLEETAKEVFLSVGAGENWHHFVIYCVQKSWGGLENLSLIPGTVGASPIQNIGAYGVEVGETIHSVTAYDTVLKEWVTLSQAACAFSYRNSLFKENKNRYIITDVAFKLSKQHQCRTDYGAIREVLHEKGIKTPSIEAISNAVIQIRTNKLPDPKKIGNAGSFFKNPTVSLSVFESLKNKFPSIIAYPISDNAYKIAAGWLIEQAGWKGIRKGEVGTYQNQALVIVNFGNAKGKEIYDFSEAIIQSVEEKFELTLEREVNIY